MLILIPFPLFAASVLPLGLKKITEEAAIIFVGHCVGYSHELDESGFPTYWVQYQIEEGVKGVRDRETLWVKRFDFQKAPVCSKTEEVVLFLYPESRAGFTSPIGFGQGQFSVETGESWRKQVTSSYPHLSEELDEIDLESFLVKVRRWVVP
ncbi:MAG: hypothetical protein HYT76_09340 [Deltaproteobacteria bacterium]|nr:hypothetical protein [Deltaproteobacteria bacterium]